MINIVMKTFHSNRSQSPVSFESLPLNNLITSPLSMTRLKYNCEPKYGISEPICVVTNHRVIIRGQLLTTDIGPCFVSGAQGELEGGRNCLWHKY